MNEEKNSVKKNYAESNEKIIENIEKTLKNSTGEEQGYIALEIDDSLFMGDKEKIQKMCSELKNSIETKFRKKCRIVKQIVEGKEKIYVIVMDPPRKGLNSKFYRVLAMAIHILATLTLVAIIFHTMPDLLQR